MTLIIILHVIISVFLVAVILLQPGKSDSGIGFGSTSQSIFGSRGAGNILTRTTAIAAGIFLSTSFFLARHRMQETGGSVIQQPPASSSGASTDSGAVPVTVPPTGESTKATETPAKPAAAPKK